MNRTYPLDGELLKIKNEIRAHALNYGLDFFEVIFEVCDYDTINILAAQGGFPARYPHWRFGMDYDQLSKGYAYGMQKIYEMVINTDPSYAYLLKANHMVDQKIVMAHVYAHSDFFKNNAWFKGTNRKMMDVMGNHSTKIRRYMERYGQEVVENFIDKVLSLENLISTADLFEGPEAVRRREELDSQAIRESKDESQDGRSQALKSFMRSQKRIFNEDDVSREEKQEQKVKFPATPQRDIMHFLAE
nr:SpoVR family protein [Bacteriovoracaceae bacterium]